MLNRYRKVFLSWTRGGMREEDYTTDRNNLSVRLYDNNEGYDRKGYDRTGKAVSGCRRFR
jgi:hypothetical protein